MQKASENLLTQVAVDVVIFTVVNDALSVLVVRRQWQPYEGTWSLPGGFIHSKETALATARRVLRDKAGLTKDVYIEQLYTFDGAGRDPRGNIPTVTYMTLVPEGTLSFTQSKKTQEPQLVPVADLPALAFDHKAIIAYALGRLQSKLEYTNVIYSLLPRQFTLTQLQTAYQVVCGRTLDKRNFRKKYLSLGIIRSTGTLARGGQRRPALMYEFISRKPAELKKFF